MWARTEPLLPGKATDPGITAADYRQFLEAVLWRDLPGHFGNWKSIFKRFRRWALSGIFEQIFNEPRDEFDLEYEFVDGTIVPTYQKAASARGGASKQGPDATGAA